ncbi:MAG: TrkA-N domain protein [Bacillota bacterium]|jgi:trk system potassium uptake protein TrkA|nr:TrkA-N domain protein [Bacillota bacterium]
MKQIIVIGCGRFGTSVAKTLNKLGHDVMVVDCDFEKIKELSDSVTHAVQLDTMDEASLKTMGLRNFDVAVIAIGSNIQASIMATLITKEAGIPMVIAKAQNDMHAKILNKIGADKVVFPERDMGVRIAHSLATPNILDVIEFSPDYSIIETVALPEWDNKTLKDLKFSSTFGLMVIAIKRGNDINITPSPDYVIDKNDLLVVLGHRKNLSRIQG